MLKRREEKENAVSGVGFQTRSKREKIVFFRGPTERDVV